MLICKFSSVPCVFPLIFRVFFSLYSVSVFRLGLHYLLANRVIPLQREWGEEGGCPCMIQNLMQLKFLLLTRCSQQNLMTAQCREDLSRQFMHWWSAIRLQFWRRRRRRQPSRSTGVVLLRRFDVKVAGGTNPSFDHSWMELQISDLYLILPIISALFIAACFCAHINFYNSYMGYVY